MKRTWSFRQCLSHMEVSPHSRKLPTSGNSSETDQRWLREQLQQILQLAMISNSQTERTVHADFCCGADLCQNSVAMRWIHGNRGSPRKFCIARWPRPCTDREPISMTDTGGFTAAQREITGVVLHAPANSRIHCLRLTATARALQVQLVHWYRAVPVHRLGPAAGLGTLDSIPLVLRSHRWPSGMARGTLSSVLGKASNSCA